jgi:hypothetical protein
VDRRDSHPEASVERPQAGARVWVTVAAIVLLQTSACTALPSSTAGGASTAHTSSAASFSGSSSAGSPSTRYLPASARLGCDDGTSGITPPAPDTPWVSGLWADGWAGSVQPAEGGVHQLPAFWKAFLYVGPRASHWTTMSVVAPASARIYYVPFLSWAPPAGRSSVRALGTLDPASGRRSITFEYCGRQPLGYPGGVTTIGPVCVTLKITAPGRPPRAVRLPLGIRC